MKTAEQEENCRILLETAKQHGSMMLIDAMSILCGLGDFRTQTYVWISDTGNIVLDYCRGTLNFLERGKDLTGKHLGQANYPDFDPNKHYEDIGRIVYYVD